MIFKRDEKKFWTGKAQGAFSPKQLWRTHTQRAQQRKITKTEYGNEKHHNDKATKLSSKSWILLHNDTDVNHCNNPGGRQRDNDHGAETRKTQHKHAHEKQSWRVRSETVAWTDIGENRFTFCQQTYSARKTTLKKRGDRRKHGNKKQADIQATMVAKIGMKNSWQIRPRENKQPQGKQKLHCNNSQQ